ncbi:MAG: hypothetical protein OSJ83_10980 [Clostridia bacterium]|nr:hypothetical protein [Clostridia bacterium]
MSFSDINVLYVDQGTFSDMPIVDTSVRLHITAINDFAAVKSKLIKLYGDVAVTADGKTAKLAELETATEIAVDSQADFAKNRYNAADALRVTARLTQDDGCPWDKAQTHESIRINMIEEAYEAVDAIDKKDVLNMREEFGDVFLQSILQSDIARRAGEFDFDDGCDEVCIMRLRRLSFIFGNDNASDPDEALGLWEKAKGIEKNYDTPKTQLSKLPENFPALLYSQKTHKKLKKAGVAFDAHAALDTALEDKDYAAAIDALTALLVEQGKDAEVELNKLVKAKIEKL